MEKLILQPGSNIIRVLTKPYQRNYNIVNQSWFIGCLSRRDNKVYYLEMNNHIFFPLRNLAVNPHWGDPEKYDIDLFLSFFYTYNEEGIKSGQKGIVNVMPIPNFHLEFDKSQYLVDTDFLNKMCEP